MNEVSVPQRSGVVDALKGLAIVAVVLGHANVGVVSSGLAEGANFSWLHQLNVGLYLVHMPLFAFLMGLTMPGAWQRHPHPKYVFQRALNFLWLYLIWTIVQGSFEVLGSRFQNGPGTTIGDVLTLWNPIAHLWFLPWAIMAIILVNWVQPWRMRGQVIVVLLFLGLLSLLMWGVEGKSIFERGMSLFIFVTIGAMIGLERFVGWAKKINMREIILALFCIATFLSVIFLPILNTRPTSGDIDRNWFTITVGVLLTVMGMIFFIIFTAFVYRYIAVKPLEYLGRVSLQIYLAHLLFTPFFRILFVKIGLINPVILDVVATLGGIVGSIVLYHVTKIWCPWIYRMPRKFDLIKYQPQSTYERLESQ